MSKGSKRFSVLTLAGSNWNQPETMVVGDPPPPYRIT
jgi:hypothetical protein